MSTTKSALFKKMLLFSVMFIFLLPSLFQGEVQGNSIDSLKVDTGNDNKIIQTTDEFISSDNLEATDDLSPNAPKKWTIMNYMDGDNNLEEAAIDDLNEMERAGGTVSDVNIIALLDRAEGYDTTNGDWTNAKIFRVEEDTSTDIDSIQLSNLAEPEMDSSATLRNFIEYCFNHYPAEAYCLNIWNHGAGVFGACSDDATGSGLLTIHEIQSAISSASSAYTEYIDIVSFDCCVMNVLESAFEFRNLCDYIVASEDNIPFDGYNYETLLAELIDNPDMTPSDFCKEMVDSYGSAYIAEESTCLSAIDVSKVETVVSHLDNLAINLSYCLIENNYKYLLYLARSASRAFSDGANVDIIDLCDNINNLIIDEKVNAATSALKAAVEDIVFYNWQHSCYASSAHGLTVFYPISDYAVSINSMYAYANRTSYFSGMDLQTYCQWGEFIRTCCDVYQLLSPQLPQFIDLGTVYEGSIAEKHVDNYLRNINEAGIYELSCQVDSGDVDIYVSTVTAGGYEIISGSYLVNPEDDAEELCRTYLHEASYIITVIGNDPSSDYSFEMNSYSIPTMKLKDVKVSTGGSAEGDDGHFKQDLHHYYQVALKSKGYTIFLSNSETSNYMISIYSLDWELLDSLSPAGLGEDLQLTFNSTEEISIIIEVCADDGEGSFELSIFKTKGAGISMVSTVVLSIMAVATIVSIRYGKKKNS